MPQQRPPLPEWLDLTGKVALVTGAAGHLGTAICEGLAEAGGTVVAASREPRRARQLAARLPSPTAARHGACTLDYLDPRSLQQAVQDVLQRYGRLDILVNNGHQHVGEDWRDIGAEGFDQQLRMATGYFLLARHVRDAAVAAGRPASIIMLASMYGMVGSYPEAYQGISPASSVAYQTLKGGILQMTRHLAVYWAADRVRVNAISPGPFPDPKVAPDELIQRLKGYSPLKRVGEPKELKGAVVLLASEAGSYITGHNLVVDGGWTAW